MKDLVAQVAGEVCVMLAAHDLSVVRHICKRFAGHDMSAVFHRERGGGPAAEGVAWRVALRGTVVCPE